MAEEVNPPKEAEASDETQGSNGVPDGYIPKDKFDAELSEAIKRRDSALKRAREAEAKAAQLEEESLARRRQKAESEGNTDEQKKLFQMELQKLQKEKESLQNSLRNLTLENKAKSKLTKWTDYPDDAWSLLKDKLDVEQTEDGLFQPIVKSNPYAPVDDFIKSFFEEKPYLAKNPKRSGTGVPEQGGFKLNDGNSVTFEQLDGMSREDRVALQRKDPKLYKAYTKYKADKAMGR